MKLRLTERNLVVILFVLVLITFSFAQSETAKMEHLYRGGQATIQNLPTQKLDAKANVKLVTGTSASIE
ncbi:MAG TPA: hypothetical protein VFP87_10825 [Chitinophagaceae bacterium]|nr:hypothetical protein [Chitinophagaceae bacterium]